VEVFYGATAADIVSQRFLSCDLPRQRPPLAAETGTLVRKGETLFP
jgi:hypothetical protein